jgi:hypothetical protein
VKVTKKQANLRYKRGALDLSRRRAFEKTEEFREQYRWRSGIEATNNLLARLGLKRLRVRGFKRAELKVKLKALGLNIWRIFAFMSINQEKYATI